MSETIVDRVARELARMEGRPGLRVTDEHRGKALILIGSMREPTEPMKTAGRDAREVLASTADVWHAMIDAALADLPRPVSLRSV